MNHAFKEIRKKTGLTQKGFAERFGIPLSTLRKWEQGESSPAKYVVDLIMSVIPAADEDRVMLTGQTGEVYYYDSKRHDVSDAQGNCIRVEEDLCLIKEQNLGLYLDEMFAAFYEIQEKFNRDCRYDQQEDILWI